MVRVVPPTCSRRLAFVALLAACVTGAFTQPAAAQESSKPYNPPLRLRIDGSSLVVPPSIVQSAADVAAGRAVTLRGPTGTRTVRAGGTSVGAFLRALGIPLEALDRIELQAGTGRTVTISGDEVRDGFSGDAACPSCQATLDAGSRPGAVNFLRPLRSASDANAGDELVPRSGQTLFLRLVARRLSATAAIVSDQVRRRVGQPFAFRIESPGVPPEQVTWFYGDGSYERGGTTARHAYSAPGSWPVSALIVGSGTFTGATGLVRVRPDRSGPQAKEPKIAPTPTPTPTATPAPSGTPGGTPGAGSQPGPPGPGTPGPVQTMPPTIAPTVAPTQTPPAQTPPPLVPPVPGAALTTIRGRLATAELQPTALAGALTAAEALAAQPDSPSRPSGAPPEDEPSTVLAGSAVSGILLVGLLSAGALTELRRARRATELL